MKLPDMFKSPKAKSAMVMIFFLALGIFVMGIAMMLLSFAAPIPPDVIVMTAIILVGGSQTGCIFHIIRCQVAHDAKKKAKLMKTLNWLATEMIMMIITIGVIFCLCDYLGLDLVDRVSNFWGILSLLPLIFIAGMFGGGAASLLSQSTRYFERRERLWN